MAQVVIRSEIELSGLVLLLLRSLGSSLLGKLAYLVLLL